MGVAGRCREELALQNKLMALEDEDLKDVREALLKLGWGNVVV